MYNRYIRQPDGTFQRRHVPDPPQPPPAPKPVCPPPESAPCPSPPPPPRRTPPQPQQCHPQRPQPCPKNEGSIGSFLRQILPKGFDTGDLLVVVLLLLLAGDCQEDQNTALLTLALYLFL